MGITGTPDGKGYWLVAADGGVFVFGDAGFYGSTGTNPPANPVIGLVRAPDGKGYSIVTLGGGLTQFGG